MNRKTILSMIRLQMEEERSRGIGYWCDQDLVKGLTDLTAGSNEPAPAKRDPRVAPPTAGGGESSPAPRRFARPPARLDPDAPARVKKKASRSRTPVAHPVWGEPPEAKGREQDWAERIAAIEKEVAVCEGCKLSGTRTNTVFGVGDATVPLVFVGEAPGAEEDRQGIPFVGRAGNLLTRIIEAMGLKREQVYICNVLKCRPPKNRDPEPDEVATCSPFLDRQLALLKPKVICTLGRHATLRLTGESIAMKALHGRTFEYRGYKVIPTYHPAALLRNPSLKALVWEDVQKVRRLLDAE